MLDPVRIKTRNPHGALLISTLNSKIVEYNKFLLKQGASSPVERALLLEEINFIANCIKTRIQDDKMGRVSGGIVEFQEIFLSINKEITKCTGMPATASNREACLMQASSSGKDIRAEFRSVSKSRWIGRTDKKGAYGEVLGALKQLSDQKESIRYSADAQEDYYHDLLKFKNFLLNKLTFEITDSKQIKYCRKILASVNRELEACIIHVPHLLEEYEQRRTGEHTLMALSSKLEALNLSNLNEISLQMSYPNCSPDLRQRLLPDGMGHLQLTRLGGSNSYNWRMQDESDGCVYLLRLVSPNNNQSILKQFSMSSMEKWFAKEYVSTISSSSAFEESGLNGSISISEYLQDGDLYEQRRQLADAQDPEVLTIQAADTIAQLMQLGQDLTDNNCVHSDIKLTNFLTRNGHVIISDVKGIQQCGENKRFTPTITSGAYVPPEGEERECDAEAFMSYQIGLALYDYLVQPQLPNEPGGAIWSQHPLNLDFTPAYFATPQGIAMKNLISRMTAQRPEQRIPLSMALQSLDMIRRMVTEQLVVPAPGEAVQEEPVPGEAVQEEPVPGEPVQEEPVPGEPVQVEPVPGEAVQEEPAPGEAVQEEPVPGEEVQEEPVQGEAVQEEPVQGEPVPIQELPAVEPVVNPTVQMRERIQSARAGASDEDPESSLRLK